MSQRAAAESTLDLVVKNVRVVRPHRSAVDLLDLGIKDGKFTRIAPEINPAGARNIFDAKGLLGFPGLVDAHTHAGIYRPLKEDADSESRAAAMGGVTTMLNYMRTGQYYLNKGGPYRTFFPEVLELSKGRFYVDYGYHLAPMSREHIGELEHLIRDHGVASFKIFMFYGGHGLHGRSDSQRGFLMLPEDEKYDLAHFEFVMRGLARARAGLPKLADHVSLSLHCELAEIMSAYTRIVEHEGKLKGLGAYHASRPPHSEGLAVCIASYLAHETGMPSINLLHLSSRKALEASFAMQGAFPNVDFRREVTVGHLVLDITSPTGYQAKVNPPIRPREDVEALWQAALDRKVDWIASDHACCAAEMKTEKGKEGDIFVAKSGFGGTEYLLSGVFSEGSRRGMSYAHMAELLCANPAKRFGLLDKGDIAPGYDADLVLLDPNKSFVARAADSESAQGYTPFEGVEMRGQVRHTFLRGNHIYDQGNILGQPLGQYLKRPYGSPKA